jgi:hypothetical protein
MMTSDSAQLPAGVFEVEFHTRFLGLSLEPDGRVSALAAAGEASLSVLLGDTLLAVGGAPVPRVSSSECNFDASLSPSSRRLRWSSDAAAAAQRIKAMVDAAARPVRLAFASREHMAAAAAAAAATKPGGAPQPYMPAVVSPRRFGGVVSPPSSPAASRGTPASSSSSSSSIHNSSIMYSSSDSGTVLTAW